MTGTDPNGPRTDAFATSALVLGIVAVLTCWLPTFGIWVSLAAVCVGVVATFLAKPRWRGVWGAVLGGIGILASIGVAMVIDALNGP